MTPAHRADLYRVAADILTRLGLTSCILWLVASLMELLLTPPAAPDRSLTFALLALGVPACWTASSCRATARRITRQDAQA